MKRSHNLAAMLALLAFVSNAWATEGGFGRPITGTGASPGMGVVPPIPGPIVSLGVVEYSGSIQAERSTPIAGQIALGVEPTVWLVMVQALYVWGASPGKWNFASAVALPYVWMNIDAALSIGDQTVATSDDDSDMYDIPLVPILAGYHFSETEHMSLMLTIWTPSGDFEVGKLANPGLNVWTFVPSVAYTKFIPEKKLELTGTWGLQFYTENPDTDYDSGVLSTLDLLGVRKVGEKAGLGAVFGWIEQISDDTGDLADRLDGYRGRAFGAGPIVTYSSKLGEKDLETNLRWVNEFNTTNRPDGNVLQLSLTAIF